MAVKKKKTEENDTFDNRILYITLNFLRLESKFLIIVEFTKVFGWYTSASRYVTLRIEFLAILDC